MLGQFVAFSDLVLVVPGSNEGRGRSKLEEVLIAYIFVTLRKYREIPREIGNFFFFFFEGKKKHPQNKTPLYPTYLYVMCT